MTGIVSLLVVFVGTVASKSACASPPSERPNIILIMADDFALGDLAFRNGGITHTPNLNRLALQSVQFTQAYSASCVCAPARAALLTGRYPHRTGVVTLNMNRFPQLTRLKQDETTIADVFAKNGYVTGLIGKWHCGTGDACHPLRRGFQEFEGFSGSQELSYFDYMLDVAGQVDRVEGNYLTKDLSRRAIDFVRRHKNQPFFLHLAHYAPHRPLEAPAEIVHKYRETGLNESTATIYAMIEIMDHGIGELLEELKRLALSAKTLVIFTSDNGPDPITGERFNEDRRGRKYEVYEGGIQVPLLVHWPGQLDPGERDQAVHFVDLFPTLLEICNIEFEPALPIDGVSLRGLLFDNVRLRPRRLYWQWNRGTPNYTHNAAVRDGPFKLVRPFVTRNIPKRSSNERSVVYNLAQDLAEEHDVTSQHPVLSRSLMQSLTDWTRNVEEARTR
ncbi:MAG: sulfatase-like hydrolase/transferase [Planctomycetota bacterium]